MTQTILPGISDTHHEAAPRSGPAPSSEAGAVSAGALDAPEKAETRHGHAGFWTLAAGSVGVVYGDIGTSPLYAFREALAPARADGILLGSPGYHGGVSGLVKNALDYTEDMRGDERPYFDGRPVGAVATGAGWQGAVTTLTAMRAR